MSNTLTASDIRAILNAVAIFGDEGDTTHLRVVETGDLHWEAQCTWKGTAFFDFASDEEVLAAWEGARLTGGWDDPMDNLNFQISAACSTLERDSRFLKVNYTEPQTEAECIREEEAEAAEFRQIHAAEYARVDAMAAALPPGVWPHYMSAAYMAIGKSDEECEEIDRWKDEAKEGYYY